MKTREITLPDSGKTVALPVVSQTAIAMKLRRKFKPPEPPAQMIDYGDGVKRREVNYSHPDYVASKKAWESYIMEKAANEAFDRLFDFPLNEEQLAELNEWKAQNAGYWDSSDSDSALWLEEIAIETENDFAAILAHMQGGEPTAEVVESIKAGFRS